MRKKIIIEGMMCQNCQKHVEEALKVLNLDVEVSLQEAAAYVVGEADNQSIINAIEEAGYEVVEIIND